ncbi:MAG: hypothetical protein QXE47_02460 [Candidatus Anstonellales archaeon]
MNSSCKEIIDIIIFILALLILLALIQPALVANILRLISSILIYLSNVIFSISESLDGKTYYSVDGSITTGVNTHPTYPKPSEGFIPTDDWVRDFFKYLNLERASLGLPELRECQFLNRYSKIRYESMIQKYTISHYNFQSDYDKYIKSNNFYNFLIVEEVLYPTSSDAKMEIRKIREFAPSHWKGLLDRETRYYGFYVQEGPVISTDNRCPITEIDGGNINIIDLYRRYGCTYYNSSAYWLVIELSNFCEYAEFKYIDDQIDISEHSYSYYKIDKYDLPRGGSIHLSIESNVPILVSIMDDSQFQNFRSSGSENSIFKYSGTKISEEIKIADMPESFYIVLSSNRNSRARILGIVSYSTNLLNISS